MAKGGESHGGDAITCFDRPYFLPNDKIDPAAKLIKQPELKDFWEFSQLLDFHLINLKNDQNLEEIDYKTLVDTVINQIGRVDPPLFYRLTKKFYHFDEIFRFIHQATLKEVNDSSSSIKPDPSEFCYEVQLAVFEKNTLPGSGNTIINKKIFDKMSELHKAGLILHELLWFEFTHNEPLVKNVSYYLRHFTFLAFTHRFLMEPFFDFFYIKNIYLTGIYDLLKHNKMDRYMLGGHQLILNPDKKYSYKNSETFHQLQLQFNREDSFSLPNEIWEPGIFKEVTPRKADNFKLCINLDSEDLKNYGNCQTNK